MGVISLIESNSKLLQMAPSSQKKVGKEKRSIRSRTGLSINVSHIKKIFAKRGLKLNNSCLCAVGGVSEYFLAEIVELADHCSKDLKGKYIDRKHVAMAVHGDKELLETLKGITFFNMGNISAFGSSTQKS